MSWRIDRQANGRFAIYSTRVDDYIVIDADAARIEEIYAEKGVTVYLASARAQMAKEMDGPDSDGVFLSCTNTTQIEAIADIERQLGKPVINSNQAVLWGVVKRLKATLGPLKPMPELGRLMDHLD